MSLINKDQIVDPDIAAALVDAEKKTAAYVTQLKALAKQAEAVNKAIGNSQSWGDLNKAIDQNITVTNEVISKQREAILVQQEELKLKQLQRKETNELAKSEEKLRKEQEKQKKATEDNNSLWKKNTDQLAKLKKEAREAALAYGENSKEAKKAAAAANQLGDKLAKIDASIGTHQRNVGNYKSALQGLGKGFAIFSGAALAITGVVSAGMQMLSVFKSFEKYKAILTNTFGSAYEANDAMTMLADTAAKLPISLDDLTQSYIKLVNRGFKPTQEELIKLSDVANSQGKSLDMFVEAMLDAQTGEFERLKEFGIKASKAGDQVTFTFKGQQTTVKNTDASIKEYLLTLGDVEGVAGSSAVVMDTLEGKISNLGDAWDSFLLMLGEGGTGNLAKKAIDWLILGIDKLKEAFKVTKQYIYEFAVGWNELIKSSESFRFVVGGAFEAVGESITFALLPLQSMWIMTKNLIKSLVDLSKGDFESAWRNLKESFTEQEVVGNKLINTFKNIYTSAKDAYDGTTIDKYLIDLTALNGAISDNTSYVTENTKIIEENAKGLKNLNKETVEYNNLKSKGVTEVKYEDTTQKRYDAAKKLGVDLQAIETDAMAKTKERLDAETELYRQQAEERKQIEQDFQDSSITLIDTLFERRITTLENEKNAIDAKYAKILDNETLTEEQRSALEAQREAEKQKLEDKQNKARKRQAQFEKAISLMNIYNSTREAIMKAWTLTPPLGAFYAGLAAATGAIQAATVIAQPIPQYFKGTTNSKEGIAEVAEKGAELIIDKRHGAWLAEKRQHTYLSGGSTVLTASQTAQVLDNARRRDIMAKSNDSIAQIPMLNKLLLDNINQGKSIEQAIKSNRNKTNIYLSPGVDKGLQVRAQSMYNHLRGN